MNLVSIAGSEISLLIESFLLLKNEEDTILWKLERFLSKVYWNKFGNKLGNWMIS